jgi:DNA-binding NtrC family response regulator
MAEKSKHLLIVEDEASLRSAIAERLAGEGFVVEEAESGEQAVARLEEFAFDVVITDLKMPGMDGGQVLAEAVGRYPDIVVIVVTGFGTVKDAVEAIKKGAADFVTKPFQFDELRHAIDAALEQRRLRDETHLRSQLDAMASVASWAGAR